MRTETWPLWPVKASSTLGTPLALEVAWKVSRVHSEAPGQASIPLWEPGASQRQRGGEPVGLEPPTIHGTNETLTL